MILQKNMMNFFKIWLKRIDWLLVAIFVLASFARFYNFPNRVTFWSEQARSLVVSANYIKEKPTLLGQEYFRVDSRGHKIFSGAYFNYSLVPLLLISRYDPVIITAFFTFLNLLTGLVIYFVSKKIFGRQVAIFSVIIFLFNNLMIYHSLFIWNYNYLPLIGILSIYLSYLYLKNQKAKHIFLLGIICGFGISLQILFIPIALLILAINFRWAKNKTRDLSLFILGVILGNLPMVLFDLRHNFYHIRTLTQYLLDTFAGKSDAGFAYYYLLPFWPIFAIALGLVLSNIFKINKFFAIGLLAGYLYINLISPKISWTTPTGMPAGLTAKDVDLASKMIADDAKGDFNVAEVLDFDKRAYVLRYFVQIKYGKKILGEEDYQNIKLLYVLGQKDYNIENSDTWEIKTGSPYKITKLGSVGEGYTIFKLQK
jgi:hypothetical protein